jgi:hypothetical protein
MWNLLKKEAEKKPQYLSITIIDTEYMMRYSLMKYSTEKYVDDQLLNTFSATWTERTIMVATNPCYQYILQHTYPHQVVSRR